MLMYKYIIINQIISCIDSFIHLAIYSKYGILTKVAGLTKNNNNNIQSIIFPFIQI
jgi:hypothetical protein